MKRWWFWCYCLLFNFVSVYSQDTIRLVSYNLLNYQADDTTRDSYYRIILFTAFPDVFVCQEITSQLAVNQIKSNIIEKLFPGEYDAGTFIDGTDSDNALFYKTSKFSFISNTPIKTALRDINEFKIIHTASQETLRIYSVHLKASSGSSNEILRAAEVDSLRQVTDALSAGTNFIVCGDFNIYSSTESAYQKLLEVKSGMEGEFYDALTMSGTWNQASYAAYHTQSPRTRSFGGGATGGMDDRFDMILYSKAVKDSGGVYYIPNSLIAYGNDGNHYNDSINEQPNTAVSTDVSNALHYASDHLPVLIKLSFPSAPLPVEVVSFESVRRQNAITLYWNTATEVENYGFEVERKTGQAEWAKIGFVEGGGDSNRPLRYSFTDYPTNIAAKYFYRLKQIDRSGGATYLSAIEVNIGTLYGYSLEQNYPNPFNPMTAIQFTLPQTEFVSLRIVDLVGKEVSVLMNEIREAGSHSILFDGSRLSSGIYFLVLTTNFYHDVRKMLLTK